MKEDLHNPSIAPELEVRIVALVLGEASDFERDQLDRLIEARPELATLKNQFQSVHGLLRDVGTGDSLTDDDDWRLSAEKRNAVLAVIGGDAEKQSAKRSLNKLAEKPRSVKGTLLWNLSKIAAVFCFVALSGSMAIRAVFKDGSTGSSGLPQLASKGAYSRDSKDASESFWGEGTAQSHDFYLMDNANISAGGEEDSRTAEPTAGAGSDSEKDSKSALGAIRDILEFDASATEGINGPAPSLPQMTDFPAIVVEEDSESALGVTLDSGAAATNGVPNPESSLLQMMVTPSILIAEEEEERLGVSLPNGTRPTDSPSTDQKAGSGELPRPRFATRAGELSTFDAAEPARSTVSVPDDGTIGLGGLKRLAEGRSEPGVSGEPDVSLPMTHEYSESESEGESQIAATDRDVVLGFVDRPAQGRQSGQSGPKALGEIEKTREVQQQLLSEFDDVLDVGPDTNFGGFAADGGGLGGGGFAGGAAGTVPADERRNEVSAEHNAQGISQRESGVLRDTREVEETAPSQRTDAGIGGGTEATDAGAFSGTKISDTARLANSIPSPTNKPTTSTEDLKNRGRRVVTDRFLEEDSYQVGIGKESVTRPSDDDIAFSNGRNLDQSGSYVGQVSGPVPGAATAQPHGGRKAGQVKQDTDWDFDQVSNGDSGQHGRGLGTSSSAIGEKMEETDQPDTTTGDVPHGIEKRVKSLLGDISARTELFAGTNLADDSPSDDYSKDFEHFEARPRSELRDEQDGLLRSRGQPTVARGNLWYRYVPPILEDQSASMKKALVKRNPASAGLNEKTAEGEAFSTFSLHVSDVSFKLARAALARGEWPEAATVRIEEFVNAFDYGDPMPSQSEKVACRLEQSIHPFVQQRNLLRVSMRTAAAGRSSSTPLRLTLLLDNSGSMERADRHHTVLRAFALLAQQLKPIDQVTLISFARQPRLLADKVSGAQSDQLVQLIDNLPSEGGTNIEAALQLALEKAQEQQIADAQNRIILLTDGAVNLGDADPESLSRMITTMRNAGIAFDAAGISAGGLNDGILEALTRKGDGRYYLLDSLDAADDGFARQIAGALRPSAKNVKVQIEFNPKRVGRYKLLGFEKHRLKQEDFRNDKVDAAEMAAAEAGVAVYQFEAKPDGEGDVGSVSVRFRDLSSGRMIENRWPIPYQADAPRPNQAAPSLRIATSAALLAARLRGEPLGETVDLKTLSDLIAGLPDPDRNASQVQQLHLMIQQARQMSGK